MGKLEMASALRMEEKMLRSNHSFNIGDRVRIIGGVATFARKEKLPRNIDPLQKGEITYSRKEFPDIMTISSVLGNDEYCLAGEKNIFLGEALELVEAAHSTLKYMIVNAPDLTDLHYKVNDQLSKGWRLQGGIAIFRGYPCQAMVKESLDEKQPKITVTSDTQSVDTLPEIKDLVPDENKWRIKRKLRRK